MKSLSRVRLFATPWTVAHQAPLSMGLPRQEYWSGLPFLLQECFPTQGLPETIKLLEENIGRTLDDINQSKILYNPPPRVMEIKTKVNKWDLIKHKKLLHSKGNYKQGEKTTLGMGDNNSK